jgi:hypothetical protein
MTDSLYLDINLHEGMLMDKKKTRIPLNGLILPYVYACSKPGQGFPTLYAVGFSLWSVSSVKMRGDCSFC